MRKVRTDNRGRVLLRNESQIKNGSYNYRYFDEVSGKRKNITSWRLLPEDVSPDPNDERDCLRNIETYLENLITLRLADRKISKDFDYLLPQLAAIYFAGQHDLRVITDSEEPVGLPIAALIPEIRLAIDVCGSEKECSLKEYICGVHGIRYINMSPKLSDTEIIQTIRKAFSDAHIHFNTHIMDDLETIRERYVHWKKKGSNS